METVDPRCRPVWTQGLDWQYFQRSLIGIAKSISCWPQGFREETFKSFSHHKSLGAIWYHDNQSSNQIIQKLYEAFPPT